MRQRVVAEKLTFFQKTLFDLLQNDNSPFIQNVFLTLKIFREINFQQENKVVFLRFLLKNRELKISQFSHFAIRHLTKKWKNRLTGLLFWNHFHLTKNYRSILVHFPQIIFDKTFIGERNWLIMISRKTIYLR